MNFKQLIVDVANEENTKSIEEEIGEFQKYIKFRTMRESCKRFSAFAWHVVIESIPSDHDEVDINYIINEVKNNSIETWGDEAQEVLGRMGIKTKQDIVDILNIALEHGVINGSSEECPVGELFN